MPPLIVMLIYAPAHLWAASSPVVIQGWASMGACQDAMPYFADKLAGWNVQTAGAFSAKTARTGVVVQCKSFDNVP